MIDMKIKLLDEKCMPYKAYETDAGMDLRTRKKLIIRPGWWETIETGIQLEIPKGMFGMILPRSGLGSQGLILRNTAAVLDCDYRGEIFLKVKNTGPDAIILQKYDRVAQLIIVPFISVDLRVVEELQETKRGEKGFGSSGAN